MRSITRLASLPILAVVLFVSAAPTVCAQVAKSPFTGTFAGPFQTRVIGGGTQNGYITITVSPSGQSVSQITNYTSGLTAVGNAVVTNEGSSTGTLVCSNGQRFTSVGTYYIDKNGNLCGTSNQYAANGEVVASWTGTIPAVR